MFIITAPAANVSLNWDELQTLSQLLFQKGLASGTRNTYASANRRYITFCRDFSIQPLPVSEQILCTYAAYLAAKGLSHRSVKCYLSAIRNLHLEFGLDDPGIARMARLQQIIRGIKLHGSRGGNQRGGNPRLPITPHILLSLYGVWQKESDKKLASLLWAAVCLAFFGFLRTAEFTLPSVNSYDKGCHLCFEDIAVDNVECPGHLFVKIKQSKTDPFRQGVTIVLGHTGKLLCPVAATLAFLAIRGSRPGPLFTLDDGSYLTRARLVYELKRALTNVGLDASKYNGHSFRIGAATTAAEKGIEDSVIQTLGRWKSTAYLLYVRLPRERLAQFSRQLAS